MQQRITSRSSAFLDQPFTADEIRRAVFDMGPNKALGPDGFLALFYQKYQGHSWPYCHRGKFEEKAMLTVGVSEKWVCQTMCCVKTAMLAKQGWGMEKNPGCLGARILKRCYYPTSSIMKTCTSDSDSMVWKNLYWGRELLDSGSRMRIGSDFTVSTFKHKWIPYQTTFKVYTPKNEEDFFSG
ncbi:hypothetical protein Ddye_018725 [Dipteronia dyeriana]|uniref:Uncharacterized protein n=1 Tax=Dipteronia dyeriana TaxID=168575 RepID=A0AAD9UB24_9ROSI|nr:hypothetical protein Ddye_018725 [Dipteronia dyeriana]